MDHGDGDHHDGQLNGDGDRMRRSPPSPTHMDHEYLICFVISIRLII